MNDKFFSKEKTVINDRCATRVTLPFPYSLRDTLECGQAFRHECLVDADGYIEYMIPIRDTLVFVGQKTPSELIFYTGDDLELDSTIFPYFDLHFDYLGAKDTIIKNTSSEWLRRAADFGEGIAILNQDMWECLISFIISQNNNIPRIRRIIREISYEYGECLATKCGLDYCPASRIDGTPCHEKCRGCGACYSFPTAKDILDRPEGLLPSHPGFRYRYILDAAGKVDRGEVRLDALCAIDDYDELSSRLKSIVGVGDKVAACVALFGFHRLDAFPIDVWMRRAIDTYFLGSLDITPFKAVAGLAQQYIFHYIRNSEGESAQADSLPLC